MIGDDDVDVPGVELGLELLDGRRDSGHRARLAGGVGHQLAALARDLQHLALAEYAGGAQGSDLTVAVAAHTGGLEAEVFEHAQYAQAGRADGRLRPLGGGQALLLGVALLVGECRRREDHLVEAVGLVVEFEVGSAVPDPAGALELNRDVGSHADILAALAGEEHGDVAGIQPKAVVDAVGRGERILGGLFDGVGCLSELLCELVVVAGHDGEASGLGGVEGILGRLGQEGQHAVGVERIDDLVAPVDEAVG